MGIVMDRVSRIRDLPITAIDDNSTDDDLFIVFAESGNSKELKISNTGLKFNPKNKNLTLGGDFTANGDINGTKVRGAVYNDIADFIEVDKNLEFEYGKVYVRDKKYKIKESNSYMEKGIIGIASDTYGFALGEKEGIKQMPIAIGGWVLAYVDKVYEPGTPLTSTKNGHLTKIKSKHKIKHPERIIAIYDMPENKSNWHGVKVNKRHWVKIY